MKTFERKIDVHIESDFSLDNITLITLYTIHIIVILSIRSTLFLRTFILRRLKIGRLKDNLKRVKG